jgi:phage-related protein
VREWMSAECSKEDRKILGKDIRHVQTRWPVTLPKCRPLGGGLYEVRSDLSSGRIARVMFGFVDGEMVLLHAFIKKTQKTSDADLAIGRDRLRQARG